MLKAVVAQEQNGVPLSLYTLLLQPNSRGSIRLQQPIDITKNNPMGLPNITYDYFSHPSDIKHVINGKKICIHNVNFCRFYFGAPFYISYKYSFRKDFTQRKCLKNIEQSNKYDKNNFKAMVLILNHVASLLIRDNQLILSKAFDKSNRITSIALTTRSFQ